MNSAIETDRPLENGGESASGNGDLISHFVAVRARTEGLCKPLEIEDYVPQPVIYISPPKWHLGHTAWFFEEMLLKVFVEGYEVFDDDFAYLFNSYYNTVGERILRADRGNLTRPTVERVYAYRDYVNRHMRTFLERDELPEEVYSLVVLGLNHEEQHQELLITDLKYVLGHNPVFPVYQSGFSLVNQRNAEQGWLDMPEGMYEIGHEGEGFAFDNEYGRHKVFLHDYSISKALVTNGEYLEFMEAGGYSEFVYWLDEGWAWVQENNIESPMYWYRGGEGWQQYSLSGLEDLDPDAVLCHLSFYEAAAYAEWKGMRLPTEQEWEAASDRIRWGQRWEWTQSAYLPYPGFAPPPGAVGEYNGKFMIHQMVLRGGSTATAPGHSRKTYRNFFHPHLQWQCTGIRLAKKQSP